MDLSGTLRQAGAIALRDGPLPLSGGGEGASQADALKTAARAFESLFVKTLLDSAFADGFGGMGESGQADQIKSMWNRQLSDSLVRGEGLGLQQALLRSLSPPAPLGASTAATVTALQRGAQTYRSIGAIAPTPVQAPTEAAGEAATNAAHPAAFVAALEPHVRKAADELGVSPRILLAQAALETGWGLHLPGADRGSHNVFGIKADASWKGEAVSAPTREYRGHAFEQETAQFRRYENVAQSVADYVRFVREQPRYAAALAHGGCDQTYIRELQRAGYATDPDYAARVLQVAESKWLSRI